MEMLCEQVAGRLETDKAFAFYPFSRRIDCRCEREWYVSGMCKNSTQLVVHERHNFEARGTMNLD